MADHAFFQYERTLQREATPELCIHLPPRMRPAAAEALVNSASDSAGARHSQQANGDVAMAEAGQAGQNGGAPAPASGPDAKTSAMELDAGHALQQQGAPDNGSVQLQGSAAVSATGAPRNGAAGQHAGGNTAGTAGSASANGAGAQHGPAPPAAVGEGTEEAGTRTVLLRIEYELAQPTAGLLFWGAYAQTDMQVRAGPPPPGAALRALLCSTAPRCRGVPVTAPLTGRLCWPAEGPDCVSATGAAGEGVAALRGHAERGLPLGDALHGGSRGGGGSRWAAAAPDLGRPWAAHLPLRAAAGHASLPPGPGRGCAPSMPFDPLSWPAE